MSHYPLRFVTAASLFDGHDVSINIMRRLLQSKGAEVIHLGHNRSAWELVDTALSEDVHAVAISSYQGGHVEYFTYVRKLLDENGGQHIRIFGGGGGVITAKEIALLESRGITKIYSPQDGMDLGLEGIIDDMLKRAESDTLKNFTVDKNIQLSPTKDKYQTSKIITAIEKNLLNFSDRKELVKRPRILGITGTGGAGKSSLIDELLTRYYNHLPECKIALISIDPSKKKNFGALLGDRIRLTLNQDQKIFMRSMATRDSNNELSPTLEQVINFLCQTELDLIIVETSGIGQSSHEITKLADTSLYVMTPEYGAQTQLEKIEMLETADFIALNKFEKARAQDALRDIRKQYKRNKNAFQINDSELPIYGTIASHFNNEGINALFRDIVKKMHGQDINQLVCDKAPENSTVIIPAGRSHYLREIVSVCSKYNEETKTNYESVIDFESLERIEEKFLKELHISQEVLNKLKETILHSETKNDLKNAIFNLKNFSQKEHISQIKGKEIKVETEYTSLSGLKIHKVSIPQMKSKSELYKFSRNENFPGSFPYAAGIFPFKRKDEDPKRQFAGEGGPNRTNKRFHLLCEGESAKRLSTAFDSVTLYGEDPAIRPDIFGKVGESGVSIATLQDMMDLYKGFDLCSPSTSVSMTINGPAPIILALFFNTAINQKLNGFENQDPYKRLEIIKQVRGTVQADILKEDQAQNTCIFSLDFALKMMGDVQEYFCKNQIKNYYAVSISGYHIAEAGANPITQLALTLSNGFTYVEYYLSRGLKIDDFAENLSFFFSNGLDPEYSVIGRVARKIWAITLKNKYGAGEKAQKLKYHIQTSGRSLHAQEIDFNDIRTTLQAFLALSDNCNSLHTNAYDEAITTPTEESVRRAMAIQLIINKEFGLNKTVNPMQGSFLISELSDLVEEAVYREFEKISDRGGVLGAMESMYQRGQIQEESLLYESLKDSGELPIIGVNTFLGKHSGKQNIVEVELTRASDDEKMEQINRLKEFKTIHKSESQQALERLNQVALKSGNIFEELLNTVQYCSLGEISQLLYKVGGRYRRNM